MEPALAAEIRKSGEKKAAAETAFVSSFDLRFSNPDVVVSAWLSCIIFFSIFSVFLSIFFVAFGFGHTDVLRFAGFMGCGQG
jgi:hypothetical protein